MKEENFSEIAKRAASRLLLDDKAIPEPIQPHEQEAREFLERINHFACVYQKDILSIVKEGILTNISDKLRAAQSEKDEMIKEIDLLLKLHDEIANGHIQ